MSRKNFASCFTNPLINRDTYLQSEIFSDPTSTLMLTSMSNPPAIEMSTDDKSSNERHHVVAGLNDELLGALMKIPNLQQVILTPVSPALYWVGRLGPGLSYGPYWVNSFSNASQCANSLFLTKVCCNVFF